MRTRIPSVIARMPVLTAGIGALILTSPDAAGFEGGLGSEDSPYRVATAQDLDDMRNHLDAHFLLTADIDLADPAWSGGQGWLPIGSSSARFTGSLDGGGHTISNLAIQRVTTSDQGLFGYLDGAEIRNLSLTGGDVSGGTYTGMLAGRSVNSDIETVSVRGVVTSGSNVVGGLAGQINGGAVHLARTDVAVTGGNQVGGLVGYLTGGGEIRHSSADGSVAGNQDVGGIAGQIYSGSSLVSDCFSHAAATGNNRVGGLVGYLWSGNVYRSFSTGAVSGPDDEERIGGLIGYGTGARDCFWDVGTSGQPTSSDGEGLTTEEMGNVDSFRHFNFLSLWEMTEGDDYPVFRDFSSYEPLAEVALESLAGSGTPEDPYIVTNASELQAMQRDLEAHYRQDRDIDLEGSVLWNMGRGWTPVGTSTAGQRFTGGLDGAGFVIKTLVINRQLASLQGLFGYTENAVLESLQPEGSNVQGGTYSGILAGRAISSRIEQVIYSGVVVAGGNEAGGLAGQISGGAVHRAHGDVTVAGVNLVGGLTGYQTGGCEIRHSAVRGSVQGKQDIGGISGRIYSGNPLVSDSYSHAAVTGESRVGGLAGYLWAGNVYRSFSAGPVSGPDDEDEIGGLIGHGTGVRDSFWDVEASGQPTSSDGEGLTTARMGDPASFRHFNFLTLWIMDEAGGYPEFRDFSGYAPPAHVELASLAGSGTPEAPYLITHANELNAMRQDLAAHFRLANDIELRDSVLWDMGRGWTPVGTSTSGQRFTGTLDGAGFEIKHLAINRPFTIDQGLIGYAENAMVESLALPGANVQCTSYGGILASRIIHGIIETVDVNGVVVSGGNEVGGLVGTFNGGRLHRGNANATVSGDYMVGGLVGYLTGGGEIRHSSARGSVTGNTDVGGLCGRIYSGSPFVTDSYSRAEVSGDSRTGGLVGYLWVGHVFRSYSSGQVNGPDDVATIGGLIGQGTGVRDSFWDIGASGMDTSSDGEGLTTPQMLDALSFRHFNFHTLWEMEDGVGRPVFQDFSGYLPLVPVALDDLAGEGTPETPYIITTAAELHAMRLAPAAHYRLGNDIDLRDSVLWDRGAGWSPVGGAVTLERFTGGFDGAGHTLSHLAINRPLTTLQGLFGYTEAPFGTKNLRIEFANVQGGGHASLLAARARNGTIETVSVEGVLVSSGSEVGGIAGELAGCDVMRAQADVTVVGTSQVGGIAGYLTAGGTVRFSLSLGSVTGTSDIGGLIGRMYGSSPLVEDSYSRAQVAGNSQVGGLIGYLWTGDVRNSYSTGPVAGWDETSTHIGGLTGRGTTVANSHWDTQTSGQTASGGGEGRTTAEMTHPHASNTYVDWDFDTLWSADSDGRNDGYPYLTPMPPAFVITAQADPSAGGGVSGAGMHPAWSTVTLEAAPAVGHHFIEWRENGGGISSEPVLAFTATADRDLTAVFALNQYPVVYQSTTGGTVSGETSQMVAHGTDAEPVVAEPLAGYSFVQWSDGLTSPARQETNVTGPVEVTAEFTINLYTLTYLAGPGGAISGPTPQTVEHGGDGEPVAAAPEPGAVFHQWSDGATANPRTDESVTGDLEVTASFRSTGGVDIAWYAGHGIAPGEGQTWADLDGTDRLGKGMTLLEEFLADTDPNDPLSRFAAGPPQWVEGVVEVPFSPSSPDRVYTLWHTTDMQSWQRVSGQIGIPGGSGPLVDPNPPSVKAFYRVEADLP